MDSFSASLADVPYFDPGGQNSPPSLMFYRDLDQDIKLFDLDLGDGESISDPQVELEQRRSVLGGFAEAFHAIGNVSGPEDPPSQHIPRLYPVDGAEISHSPSPSPAPLFDQPDNAYLPSTSRSSASPRMEPPAKRRKGKAPTLRADAWEPHKARILELHIDNCKPLAEVKVILEAESGFIAEIRQYRTRITQWGRDKNVKKREYQAIVRKRQERKLLEPDKRDMVFEVRDNIVDPRNIDRWMKRNNVPESILYAPSPAASTPSAIHCRTISERGSVARMTPFSVFAGTPHPVHAESPRLVPPLSVFAGSPEPVIGETFRSVTPLSFSAGTPRSEFENTPQPPSPASISSTIVESTEAVPGGPVPDVNLLLTHLSQEIHENGPEWHLFTELTKVQTMYGSTHPHTVRTLAALGEVLRDQGRYRTAEGVFQTLVSGSQRRNSANEVSVDVEALEHLGVIWHLQGLHSKAEPILRLTFKYKKNTLGLLNVSTLVSMNNLVRILYGLGRFDEAKDLGERALASSFAVTGPQHLHIMCTLACIHLQQQSLERAHMLSFTSMETAKITLGREHPTTLHSMDILASTYMLQRHSMLSMALRMEVTEASQKVFGIEHPFTLRAMTGLATLHIHEQRWDLAEELLVQVVKLKRSVLGFDHPNTLTSMALLAIVYRAKGHPDTNQLGVEVMEARKKVLGADHPDTLSSIRLLSSLEHHRRKLNERQLASPADSQEFEVFDLDVT